MYYPPSQIKTDQYTNGDEFVYYGTSEKYTGFYYIVGDGRYFTGKNPNDSPQEELVIYTPTEEEDEENTTPNNGTTNGIGNPSYSWDPYVYSKLKSSPRSSPNTPNIFYPKPTEEDYQLAWEGIQKDEEGFK